MKVIIFSVYLLLGISCWANAQTRAGNLFVGGALGWDNNDFGFETKDDLYHQKVNQESKALRIEPKAGFFLQDNLLIGLLLDYQHQKEQNIYLDASLNNTRKNVTVALGPFVRKYFALNDKFSLYGQGMVGYAANKSKTEYTNLANGEPYRRRGLAAALQPGIAFFATDKLGIDLTVQGIAYNLWKTKGYKKWYGNMEANFNLPSLNVGFNFYLSR